ncbi:type II secretion system protein GspG [Aeoliella sp. ICT_H6.2]|uniref:Type II secretion system protein GspG n=1 Tax=Aeoliella straminimaris TaxID=2954799 RepID=A0A9X2FEV7_9BACT|nr:type II secretion system protein GspG [Aeoliella straminimaris]MCO6044989.1 type II secretion system protein GspG [Aeoliella straminimaris]
MFKRILKWSAIALGVFMVYFLWQLFWPSGPIEVSTQTTVITEPLADDGLPNYSKYLLDQMREGVTPENNGAIPLLQAMWPAELEAQDQQLVCRELGMEVLTTDGLRDIEDNRKLIDDMTTWYLKNQVPADEHLSDLDHDIKFFVENDYLRALGMQPWQADDAPPVADWVEAHAHDYALLHEAMARPEFYLPAPALLANPKVNVIVLDIPELHYPRPAVRSLALRANLRIGSGDLAGAWQDCQTMYRLADLETHCTLVSKLVAYACEGQAKETLLQLLQSPDLTPELAADMQQFITARQPGSTMRDAVDSFERIGFVTGMLEMSHARTPENPNDSIAGQFGIPIISAIAIDWNAILEIGNQEYDQIVAALDEPTATQQQAALDAWSNSLTKRSNAITTPGGIGGTALSRSARSKNIAYVLCQLLLPSIEAALGAERRVQSQRLLSQTAIALARYRLAHGEYPEQLGALVPDYLAAPLVDPHGNALAYQRTSDGFLLYSLGADGKDQGGSHEMWKTYQGYEMADTEAADRALRKRLGLPEYEPEFEGDYEFLRLTEPADDVAIRLPKLELPLPEFEPPDEPAF